MIGRWQHRKSSGERSPYCVDLTVQFFTRLIVRHP
jgi:hypothetical protein